MQDWKLRHMSGPNLSPDSVTHSPLKQRGLPIQDVAHAECDPPKWLTVSPHRLRETGNCAARTASKAPLTHSALKQQGPSIQPRLPFVSARAAVVTPGATGCWRFLMSHFYSGDKVSYPRWLKRPWGAVEWQPRDARQTHRDTLATGRGGGTEGRNEGVKNI